jgi:hypothetical protein
VVTRTTGQQVRRGDSSDSVTCEWGPRVINTVTGELRRELTIDPDKDYQPRK